MLYALQRHLRYFGILGLVPWKEKGFQQQLQRIYTIGIIAFNVGLALFVIFNSSVDEKELLVSLLVGCIVFIFQIITMTVIELQVMCQYNEYFEFCDKLKCVKQCLENELQQPVRHMPWTSYVKFYALGILNIVGVSISTYVVSYCKYVGYFWYSIGAVIIIRFQCLLLLLYADILAYHVDSLVSCLQALNITKRTNSVLNAKCEKLNSLEYMLTIKHVYMQLYRLYCHFNGLYGWSILCIFVVLFLDSMINIYWTWLIVKGVYDFVYIYYTFSTFVPLLILLFNFCHCGEHCRRQHLNIGSHVRGLANHSYAEFPPKPYNAVLSEFAMQVEQDALIISAEGFMDIDYSLLMSIFTALVTFIIVLMQFSSL